MSRPFHPVATAAKRTLIDQQRDRLRQALLVLALYVVLAAVQQAEVMMGLIDQAQSNALTAVYVTGSVVFIAVIRSGLNLRLTQDLSLTALQCTFSMLALAGSYAITGPARGAVLCLMAMILVFSVFTMGPLAVRRLALFGVFVLAAAMLWKAKTDPQRYAPAMELIHLMLVSLVAATITMLSVRMSTLRERVRKQKVDLEHALEQVHKMATTDALTGLFNRRHMSYLLAAEKARMERDEAGMCLVLLDIDWFKRVNDSYGHKAGDDVLSLFGQAVASALRVTDVVARWGGEEFLLMLPATTPQLAGECVDRVRASMAQAAFAAIQPGLQITFSAGLAYCGVGADVQASIELADQALYRAKQGGRNQTVVAQHKLDCDLALTA